MVVRARRLHRRDQHIVRAGARAVVCNLHGFVAVRSRRDLLLVGDREARPGEGPVTPFGPPRASLYVCTTDPRRDCQGHEICGAAGCRAPWPPNRPPPIPSRTYMSECRTSQECPTDTTCLLFYAQGPFPSSYCNYNIAGETDLVHVTPTCTSDADCKTALPLWKTVLGDEAYAKALAGVRCVGFNDLEHRKACAIPGNAPLP